MWGTSTVVPLLPSKHISHYRYSVVIKVMDNVILTCNSTINIVHFGIHCTKDHRGIVSVFLTWRYMAPKFNYRFQVCTGRILTSRQFPQDILVNNHWKGARLVRSLNLMSDRLKSHLHKTDRMWNLSIKIANFYGGLNLRCSFWLIW